MGGQVKLPRWVALDLHFRSWAWAWVDAIHILLKVAVQIDGVEEQSFGTTVRTASSSDAHEESSAVVRMDGQIVPGGITHVGNVLFNLTLRISWQIALLTLRVPVQIWGTVDDPRETLNTCHVLTTVLGVWV